MPPAASVNPLENINFIRPIKLWLNGRKLDRLIGEELDKRFKTRDSATKSQANGHAANGDTKRALKPATRNRSVVTLALDTYQKEFQPPSSSAASTPSSSSTAKFSMDPTFRATAIDQIKTFIFAGHDTTSSTIAYAFYLLHTSPRCHGRLAAELDAVLGPGATAPSALKSSPHLINNLPYTTAVFKEVLRLFPPASTLRYASPDSDLTLTDPATGTKYPLAGCEIWPASHAIHRNEKYFPRPLDFVPERFMPPGSPEFAEFVASLPDGTTPATHKDSWRPFEKGPRNCIGQELAVLEIKVILALSVRQFDFRCRFPEVEIAGVKNDGSDGGVRCESVDERWPRWMVEGHRCVQVLKGSAKPAEAMPGVVLVR
jgi:hypothetical protein